MGKIHTEIDSNLTAWLQRQQMFFVSTAPLAGDGLINCSPKGLDTLRVLGPRTVAYLDLTGSGVETIAHLKENGRIVIMLCAFEGAPKIVRFHGRGEVLEPGHPEFQSLLEQFPRLPGTRAIIRVDVQRIADSCGFAVPQYTFEGPRDTLIRYAENRGEDGLEQYRWQNNRQSLDGLPGLDLQPPPG